MKTVELKPIKESTEDDEAVERQLKMIFRREIYLPLIRELGAPNATLRNTKYNLLQAIRAGRIYYYVKSFLGKFSSSISKELGSWGRSGIGHKDRGRSRSRLCQSRCAPLFPPAKPASNKN